MGKRRKGKCKKLNVQAASEEPEELVRAPHSFIFHRGLVGKHIHRLLKDFRHVMEPFTASHLRARKSNSIKDFVAASGVLHVSHMLIFTQTILSPYMRIVKLPRGPTLTFKLHNYTHSNDVLSSLRKQYAFNKIFLNPPLVVLNGFSGDEPHIKLMVATFQGMFPTINVTTVNLKNISRCVLFNYDPETKTIDFRHYVVRAVPVGISKAVKKLGRNKIPDLSRFTDVADFMTKAELLSDSEVDDDPNNKFSLPQSVGPRATKGNQAAVRLTEYGPRITMQLIKVEEGVMDGEVMFHEYIQKTEEEKEMIRKRLVERKKLKEKRRREQLANIKRKEEEQAEAKKRSLKGMNMKDMDVDRDIPQAAEDAKNDQNVEVTQNGNVSDESQENSGEETSSSESPKVNGEVNAASSSHSSFNGECQPSTSGLNYIDCQPSTSGLSNIADRPSTSGLSNGPSRPSTSGMSNGFFPRPSTSAQDDNDAEYFRQEVGVEPDPGLFQPTQRKSILKPKKKELFEFKVLDNRLRRKPSTGTKIRWSTDVKPPNVEYRAKGYNPFKAKKKKKKKQGEKKIKPANNKVTKKRPQKKKGKKPKNKKPPKKD